MRTQSIRLTAAALLSALAVGLVLPVPAHAGKEGRRNTAIGLGAVAAYGVVKKKPVVAGVAGAGAIASYVRSQQSSKKKPKRKVVHVHHYRRPRGRVVHHYHRRPRVVHHVHRGPRTVHHVHHARGRGHHDDDDDD